MIRVEIERDPLTSRIVAFRIRGHAQFAEEGRDIVCVGVSAVSVGTVNAVESLLSVSMQTHMEKGNLAARLPDHLDEETAENAQLILESMVVMLRTIEASYGEYVNVTDVRASSREQTHP